MQMSWIIYMLVLKNNAFYTGITNNIEARMQAHRSGKGSKYVRAHLPFSVIYIKEVADRSEATKGECCIKKLSRKDKEKMLKTQAEDTILLFCDACGVVISLERYKYTEPEFDFQCIMCRNIISYTDEVNK